MKNIMTIFLFLLITALPTAALPTACHPLAEYIPTPSANKKNLLNDSATVIEYEKIIFSFSENNMNADILTQYRINNPLLSHEDMMDIESVSILAPSQDVQNDGSHIYIYKYVQNPTQKRAGHYKLDIVINPPSEAPYVISSEPEAVRLENGSYTASLSSFPENGIYFTLSEKPLSSSDWAKRPLNYFSVVIIAIILTSSYITSLVIAGWRMSNNHKR